MITITIHILQKRDLSLLTDLYSLQILSANQIKRLYFENSKYGYSRTRQLQESGYLSSKPLVQNGKKKTQYYYLTEQGMKEVCQANIFDYRSPSKNRPANKYLTERQLAINEIYITIKLLENKNKTDCWEWLDSRQAKDKFNLNRSDLISGCLINKKNNRSYAIYLPYKANKLDDMQSNLSRIGTEIERNMLIGNNIILCPDEDSFKIANNSLKVNGRSIILMPYPKGINFIYNFFTSYEEKLVGLYSEYFQIPKEDILTEQVIYATHSIGDFYLTEHLSNDLARLNLIKRYINDRKESKKLYVLCWNTQEKELMKIMSKSDKIVINPISWRNSPLVQGVDESEMYNSFTQNKKVPAHEKAKPIAISLSGRCLKFIKGLGKGQRSNFIQRLIEESEEYKKTQIGEGEIAKNEF